MLKGLTKRQKEVLDFIERYTESTGYPPSIRDCKAGLSIGTVNGVRCHFQALEAKGFIDRAPSLARSVRVKKTHKTKRRELLSSIRKYATPVLEKIVRKYGVSP